MNWKKFMIILILIIFTTGMSMGATSASHTFKDKGYKYKMSDKKLKSMKKYAKKYGHDSRHGKVSKKVKTKSKEKITKKTFKKAQANGWSPYDKSYKFVSCKKISNGNYNVVLKRYGYMNCQVDYYSGKYHYSAVAYYKAS